MSAHFHKADTAEFLRSLHMDVGTAITLSREFFKTFQHLASDSLDQFLPTPIAESILRPEAGQERGRYVTITERPFIFISCFCNTPPGMTRFNSCRPKGASYLIILFQLTHSQIPCDRYVGVKHGLYEKRTELTFEQRWDQLEG